MTNRALFAALRAADEWALAAGLLAGERALPLRPGASPAYVQGWLLGWSRLRTAARAGRCGDGYGRYFAAARRAADTIGVTVAPIVQL